MHTLQGLVLQAKLQILAQSILKCPSIAILLASGVVRHLENLRSNDTQINAWNAQRLFDAKQRLIRIA